MAVYLGQVEEEKILAMSIPFFDGVLEALGYRLNYDAVVNYAGNSFCEKSWEMISENNPLGAKKHKKKDALGGLGALLSGKSLTVIHTHRTPQEAMSSPPEL